MLSNGVGGRCGILMVSHPAKEYRAMNNPTRLILWLVAGLIACLLVVLGTMKLVGRIYLSSGRGESSLVVPPLIFVTSCASVTVVCFLILWLCAARAGYRTSVVSLASISLVALIIGVCSGLLGRPPYQNFLDGFVSRVSANLKESDAVTWAEQVFADSKLAQTGDSVVRLPQSKVPAFFSPLFSGATPSAVVSYSKSGSPICVHVFVGGGFGKWGVAIFNTNSTPTNDAMDYRQCGNRVFAFQSNR
jgi:hypothetical protein